MPPYKVNFRAPLIDIITEEVEIFETYAAAEEAIARHQEGFEKSAFANKLSYEIVEVT